MTANPKDKKNVPYPGIALTTNGNQLVAYYTESRLAEAGVFYPITPSTEMGEMFQMSFAKGELNVFGEPKIAIEAEGEHAAQGGAIAVSVTGKRTVNFTSGQGVLYALEQYYHAPGKLSTMVIQVAARPLTKHALNVHCGHDDVYAALDTGWNITFAIDAQQAADQSLILRKVNELSLTPGMNAMDGFLTSHLDRVFRMHEAQLIRDYMGQADDIIDCPTPAQRELFGPKRRRLPECYDLKNPALLGSVQNQEHYMGGVAARRNHFVEPILGMFEKAYEEFAELTGRSYGLVSEYNNEDAEVTFVALGSAAENCQATVDYIQEKHGEKVGVVHINVLRPFPEAAVVKALAGKKKVIILERSDDHMAGDGYLARDIRTALAKASENHAVKAHEGIPAMDPNEVPRIFSGVYGLGSRDFRPESILGAYEFAQGRINRQDGKSEKDGASFIYLGINHPYNVESKDTPSLLPEGSIAVRFHSIGGWGMITTGKNLSGILGDLGGYAARRDFPDDPEHLSVHISANPKYGSEKKGSPTNYFLVAAPKRVRVNCDLRHVNVVLCCDPKIFTHSDPLVGLEEGGSFVWESSETDDAKVWERIPPRYRKTIVDKKIRVFTLQGFEIAKAATERPDLQYRMQGNSFLGAFFKVSPFLQDFSIPDEEFLRVVLQQYENKFGKFGAAVVESNMTVMKSGFEQVHEIKYGQMEAPDTSSMRGEVIVPLSGLSIGKHWSVRQSAAAQVASPGSPVATLPKPALMSLASYDAEYRADFGYDQPCTPHASTGVIAAATGATSSKYGARRETPLFIAENCTQCMACITACPDTALPNTAQDISTVLKTTARSYIQDNGVRNRILEMVADLDPKVRDRMNAITNEKGAEVIPFHKLVQEELNAMVAADTWFKENQEGEQSLEAFYRILSQAPMAYGHTTAIFRSKEKKEAGSGGLFSIFVSDLCKGCAECVHECGDHNALVMVDETEEVNGLHETGIAFLDLLPNTPEKYLGKYDPNNILESRPAVLQNHLMQRSNYEALVSGDGACAGCGEKSILHMLASVTEAYMRPLYHLKADRLTKLADHLTKDGLKIFADLKGKDEQSYTWLRRAVLHLVMGFGGENTKDTDLRLKKEFGGTDHDLVEAMIMVLRQDAYNHRHLQSIEGGPQNGMSVMAMAASTGCNTVYGSTHPNNPHPYPWMNSLFQDGPTIGWLFSETFIVNHSRRSVVPERLAKILVDGEAFDEKRYFRLTHLTDGLMTEREIQELPKVWCIGGDGALGDIGFQNLSKAMLQCRPNFQVLMLDTQVYSNTGGQNSDSSPMPGGFDMNQLGAASEGKLTEKKGVAEILMGGHGSPFVAQVSMGNVANLFAAILGTLTYRGSGFLQCFTTCQPEHGVADDISTLQAKLIRDSRGMPEFIFDPDKGESYQDALSLKGNPSVKDDWWGRKTKGGEKYQYTTAHWAHTEARFRRHFMKVKKLDDTMINLEDILLKISQKDVIHRNVFVPGHRSYVSEPGVYMNLEQPDGTMKPIGISRQMVLFCVERRKSWRMLQSRAGIETLDRLAQARVLADFDAEKIPAEVFHGRIRDLNDAAKKAHKAGDKKTPLVDLLESDN